MGVACSYSSAPGFTNVPKIPKITIIARITKIMKLRIKGIRSVNKRGVNGLSICSFKSLCERLTSMAVGNTKIKGLNVDVIPKPLTHALQYFRNEVSNPHLRQNKIH